MYYIDLKECSNGKLLTGGIKVQIINGGIMVPLLTKEHLIIGAGDTIVKLLSKVHLLTFTGITMVQLMNYDTKPPLITGGTMV